METSIEIHGGCGWWGEYRKCNDDGCVFIKCANTRHWEVAGLWVRSLQTFAPSRNTNLDKNLFAWLSPTGPLPTHRMQACPRRWEKAQLVESSESNQSHCLLETACQRADTSRDRSTRTARPEWKRPLACATAGTAACNCHGEHPTDTHCYQKWSRFGHLADKRPQI